MSSASYLHATVNRMALPPISGAEQDAIVIPVDGKAMEVVARRSTGGTTISLLRISIYTTLEHIPVSKCSLFSVSSDSR